MSQLDLFARPRSAPAPVSYAPDPADIRAKLQGKLAELTRAEIMPWSEQDLGLWRILVPQMSNWLPANERAELIVRFNAEVARLTAN